MDRGCISKPDCRNATMREIVHIVRAAGCAVTFLGQPTNANADNTASFVASLLLSVLPADPQALVFSATHAVCLAAARR